MKALATLCAGIAFTALSHGQGILASNGEPDPSWPGFHAWYRTSSGLNGLASAPANGTSITRWNDATGQGHDLVRIDADVTRRPHYDDGSLVGYPGVRFDGDDYVWGDRTAEFGTLTGDRTLFVVARLRAADGGYLFDGTSVNLRNALIDGQSATPGLWNVYVGNGTATRGAPAETDAWQVHTVELSSATHVHRVNGLVATSGNETLAPLGGLVLGSRYSLSEGLIGTIAEVLVYERALATTDRLAVEGYLRTKFPPSSVPVRPTPVEVFRSGDGLYHTYRIPAIQRTQSGALLAFAEGRASASDHAQNDIVMRRSDDGGNTWGPVITLRDEGGDSLNNPCVMQIERGLFAGRLILMYQRYPQGCHTNCVQPGFTGSNVLRSYYMVSNDDGRTWTWPVEITASVKRPSPVRAVSSGPGIGIQKRHAPNAGRIVFPFNQVDLSGSWKVYTVFSDNGGIDWSYGQVADDSQIGGEGNEVQIIERSDGSLLLNSRRTGGKPFRKVAESFDAGLTWTPLRDDEWLASPRVMASVFQFTDPVDGFQRERILFSGPLSLNNRRMGAVHLSHDGGTTWPWSKIVERDGFAYSVLTSIDERTMGCLYETDDYGRISLVRFTVEWLSDGRDCLGNGLHDTSYGQGCLSSNGLVPTLTSSAGCATPGGTLVLSLADAPANAVGTFLFGWQRIGIPFGSCTLLVDPLWFTAGVLACSAQGDASFALPIPNLPGLTFPFTAQALVLDPQLALGFAASAGLALMIF
ncbi:MAG: exo-alpha-sialidase [Planctomycetes bacterium]|nr:exo-alpha-sialidase [Planctomycetota bacterium]MCB9890901.1 exo-alpha-sialidase [Planctomycetota bacterium]